MQSAVGSTKSANSRKVLFCKTMAEARRTVVELFQSLPWIGRPVVTQSRNDACRSRDVIQASADPLKCAIKQRSQRKLVASRVTSCREADVAERTSRRERRGAHVATSAAGKLSSLRRWQLTIRISTTSVRRTFVLRPATLMVLLALGSQSSSSVKSQPITAMWTHIRAASKE